MPRPGVSLGVLGRTSRLNRNRGFPQPCVLRCPWVSREAGGSAGIRTRDLSIKSRLLYRLSYGPTSRHLGAGAPPVNRVEQRKRRAPRHRIAPMRGHLRQRGQDEATRTILGVRHDKSGARPAAARPEHDVQIDYPRTPALPPPPAEVALDRLQPAQQRLGRFLGRDPRNGVGEAPDRRPQRGRFVDARDRAYPADRRQRRPHLRARAAVAAATVGAKGDDVACDGHVPAPIAP